MTIQNPYPEAFYANRDQRSKQSAEAILRLALEVLPQTGSAVDFGCGVGTWLAVVRSLGVGRIQGYEGAWLNQELLEIPADSFATRDFSGPINTCCDRRFDLAMSLEVAEHLPEANAASFVNLLTNSADFVLFSAAVPGQGGKGHVNEQWPDYWAALFAGHGYTALDPFRHLIWDNPEIRPWYRQNTLLMVRHDRLAALNLDAAMAAQPPRRLVHPDIFLAALTKQQGRIDRLSTARGAWHTMRSAFKNR